MNEDQIFIYDGEEYSKEQVLDAANQFGMTLEDYVVTHGLTVKKEAVVEGATAGPSKKAPVTESNSVPTSSGFPEFAEKPKPARAQTDIDIEQKRGGNQPLTKAADFKSSLAQLDGLGPEAKEAGQRIYNIIQSPLSPEEIQSIEKKLEPYVDYAGAARSSLMGVGSTGPGSFNNTAAQAKTVLPYEEYKDAAREQIKINGGNTESAKAVDEVAKDLMRQDLTRSSYQAKIDDILRDLEDNTEDWQGWGDVYSSIMNTLSYFGSGVSAAGSGEVYDTESSGETRYATAREQLSSAIKEDVAKADLSVKESAKRIGVSTAQMENAQIRIEEVKKALMNAQTEDEYNTYLAIFNQDLGELQAMYSIYEQDVKNIERAMPLLTYGGIAADMAIRSYDQGDVFAERYNAWTARTLAGVATFTETMAMKAMQSQVPGALSPEIVRSLYTTPAEQVEDVLLNGAEWSDRQVRYHKQFLESEDWQDFIDATVDLAGDQVGQLGLMAMTGGTASSVIIGSSVAGQKMQDMNEQRSLGKEFTDAQYYGSALLYGVAEAGSEYITFKQLGRNLDVLRNAAKVGAITTDQLRNSVYKNIVSLAKTKGYDMLEEGGTEAISQFSQNITDMYLLKDKNVRLFDGVDESFVSGAMMSLMMGVAPGAAAGTAKLFINRTESEKVKTNHNRILELQKEQVKLKEEIDALEVNDPKRAKLQQDHKSTTEAIEDLYMANTAIMYTGIDRIDQLTTAEKAEVLDISKALTTYRSDLQKVVEAGLRAGKEMSEIKNSQEYLSVANNLARAEENLYDTIDQARDPEDKEKAWNAMEAFARENGGIPSALVATKDENWKDQLRSFFYGTALNQYYTEKYGEDVAKEIRKMAPQLIDYFESQGNDPEVFGTALRQNETIVVERDGQKKTITVPLPRVILSQKGSWRHESAHMTLFNNLMTNGGHKHLVKLSQTLTQEIARLAKIDPDKYGALERYSLLRKNYYAQAISPRLRKIKEQARIVNMMRDSNYKKQSLKALQDQFDLESSIMAEEHAIAVMEYMAANNIRLDKRSGVSFVKNALEAVGLKQENYDFADAGEVFRMLRNFNKRFDAGKTRRSLKALDTMFGSSDASGAIAKAPVKLEKFINGILYNAKNEVDDRSKAMADKVNKIYKEEGPAGIFRIAELYKGMVAKSLQKNKYLPNFEFYKEDIESEVLWGSKRGLYYLVNQYDQSLGIPLAAYINKYLPPQIDNVVQSVLGKDPMFMSDVTEISVESSEISMDELTDDILDSIDETAAKHSVVRRLLGLDDKQMNRVRGSVLLNLSYNPEVMETRKWVPSVFLSNLLEAFKVDLFNLMKGQENSLFPKKNQDWFAYAEKMYDWITNTDVIPLSTWMRHKVDIMYDQVIDPVTNKPMRMTAAEGAVARISDPLAGNKVWKTKNPTKEEWMAWIKAEGINPKTGKEYSWTTVGTRKDMLATALARHMALDAVMETLTNPAAEVFDPQTGEALGYTMDVLNKWETMTGEDQNAVAATAHVAYIINRDPNLLFNKKGKNQLNGFFDISEAVMDRVAKNVTGASKYSSFQEAMLDNDGDWGTQRSIAETYAREIIKAIEELVAENVINPPSVGIQKQLVEELLRAEFHAVTQENELWKEVLRAGMSSAQARLTAQEASVKAKVSQRKKDGAAAVAQMSAEATSNLSAMEKLNEEWNELMQDTFGNRADISRATAQSIYDRKPWWKKIHSAMNPRSEDFFGLLYWTMGKGNLGQAMKVFYVKNLLEPFNRASSGHDAMRVGILTGYKALNRSFKSVVKRFDKVIFTNAEGKSYTIEDVVKVKMWARLGYNIPDISTADLDQLLGFNFKTADGGVSATSNLDLYVDGILKLFRKSNGDTFAMEKPKESRGKVGGTRTSWDAVPIQSYILATLNGDVRKQLMKPFSDRAEAIFTEYNMNKLEALFGSNYVDALRDSIEAMNSGRAPFRGKTPLQRKFEWWYNGSIGMIMFLNLRSAALQFVSTTNYINWSDNNPLKMAQALSNPKEYAKAFAKLMNSDFMKVRRNSGKIDVEMTDIEEMIQEKNFGAFYSRMMKMGYLLTRYADSGAILLGGTSLYVNRVKTYLSEGLSQQDAENKAFEDFREITETNQQSARQDKLSQEQRSPIGRIILAFGNTSMQYSRIMVKSAKDVINGRGDLKTNLSKIMYYGMVQNAIFTLMQQGIFKYWLDDDDEEDPLKQFSESDDMFKAVDSMVDNVARGFGVYGAVGVALKKTAFKIQEKYNPEYKAKFGEERGFAVAKAASSISPALSYKLQKISDLSYNLSQRNRVIQKTGQEGLTSLNTLPYDAEIMATSAEFFVNLPLKRLLTKYDNVQAAYQNEYNMALRVANVMGWPDWQLDPEVSKARQAKKYELSVDDISEENQAARTKRILEKEKSSGGGKIKNRADITKELAKQKRESNK